MTTIADLKRLGVPAQDMDEICNLIDNTINTEWNEIYEALAE